MKAFLDFGWVALIIGASLLPILITALRGVPPGRRRLIGLLTIACMLARGFGYFGPAWLLLPPTCGWALLMLWAGTARTSMDDALDRDPIHASVTGPETDPGTSTAAATWSP
jgi:hypothetical protein